jgi:hypothetical protein
VGAGGWGVGAAEATQVEFEPRAVVALSRSRLPAVWRGLEVGQLPGGLVTLTPVDLK